mgnify:CR=1 FL=1
MIDFLYQNFSRNIQLFFLWLGLGKNYRNFKDLNFKQNDFINYKIIKYYLLKNNFIHNLSIQDVHTFNFLFFYQKLGGKNGIDLSKLIYPINVPKEVKIYNSQKQEHNLHLTLDKRIIKSVLKLLDLHQVLQMTVKKV